MKKIVFKGCGTAIVTPFTKDNINFEEFRKLIELQISEKANSIIVCGTTGEASTMTLEEKKSAIKFAKEVVQNKIPVIAGVGGNCTTSVISMCHYCESIGVDAVLAVTPYYNKTTQLGLIAHYKEIAYCTKLPIILYNVPSRTGLNLLPSTCLELSKIKNIVAIKEASGNISQVAEICALCKNNLNVYSGNDDQILSILSLGGIGVISVVSNISPKLITNITKNFFNNNIKSATKAQLKIIPLIKALFAETNPIPIKYALNILGYNCGIPRLPLIELSQNNREILKSELLNLGYSID